MTSIPDIDRADIDMSGTELVHPTKLLTDQENFGSPLKNVAMTISALNSPLEVSKPTKEPEGITSLNQTMQQEVAETAPSTLPPPPPEPTIKEEIAAVRTLREEEEEEEMLLDIIDGTNQPNDNLPAAPASIPDTQPVQLSPYGHEAPALPPTESGSELSELKSEELTQIQPEAAPQEEVKEEEPVQQSQDDDDDDDFPDLLGGLEKSLEKQHNV